jgi:hypothetical protein
MAPVTQGVALGWFVAPLRGKCTIRERLRNTAAVLVTQGVALGWFVAPLRGKLHDPGKTP